MIIQKALNLPKHILTMGAMHQITMLAWPVSCGSIFKMLPSITEIPFATLSLSSQQTLAQQASKG